MSYLVQSLKKYIKIYQQKKPIAQIVIIAWLAFFGFTQSLAQQPASNKNYIGINLRWATDWTEDRMFADAMKTARPWFKANHLGDTVYRANVDTNFWPTEDAALLLFHLKNTEGTYKVSFTGKATSIDLGYNSPGSIQNIVYTAATNTTTCDMVIERYEPIYLQFNGTNGGIKNLKVMRPITLGSTTSYPTSTLFTDQVKNLIAKFQAIRFMDYFSTNSNSLSKWSQRALPTDASFQHRELYSYSWANIDYYAPVGGCYEYAIMLCNETGKDFWLNIPLKADDAYITKLAQLIKYGSDGVNPYTSTQANPIYPPLNSNIKVYVEYSNEVWNTAPGFQQGNDNHAIAQAEVAAGNSPLNYDGETNDWYWARRRVGKRTVDISNIFRSVFGDASMMTQIRPVLMSQQGYMDIEAQSLALIDQVYGKTTQWCNTPHPVNYYIYGAGGSGYYGPDSQSDNLTIDNIWTSGANDPGFWVAASCKSETAMARAFGLKRICYEGGPSLDKTGHSDAIKELSVSDSRMKTNMVNMFDNAWSATDGDLFMYYASTMSYEWGFTENIFDLNTPKLNGIDQLNTQTKAPVTVCATPPLTINGKDCDGKIRAGNGWSWDAGNALNIRDNYYAYYMFRITQAGNYNVSAQLNENTGSLTINCDGKDLGVQTISGTLPSYTLSNLQPGLHTVMFKTTSTGTAEIQSVTINLGLGEITSLESNNTKVEKSDVYLYPNPVNSNITVSELNSLQSNNSITLSITDISGLKLLVKNVVPNTNTLTLDVSSFKNGVYFITIETSNGSIVRRFIKK